MDHLRRTGLPFIKMHGLGNDFVILDLRIGGGMPSPALAQRIADRHFGVGFDQLATVETGSDTDLRLVFLNADGSRSGACGNATRCIARWEMDRTDKDRLTLRTDHGVLRAEDAGGGMTRVNMGPPVLDWQGIPLARDADLLHLPIDGDPVATGMGNPHMTFFVPDLAAVDLPAFGAAHEHHPLYPQRTNVEVVQVLSPDAIRVGVWERGTGITLASGTCSCAAAVAAARRELTGRRVTVHLPGGALVIDWREDGVWMEGPSAVVFSGTLTPDWLGAEGDAGEGASDAPVPDTRTSEMLAAETLAADMLDPHPLAHATLPADAQAPVASSPAAPASAAPSIDARPTDTPTTAEPPPSAAPAP